MLTESIFKPLVFQQTHNAASGLTSITAKDNESKCHESQQTFSHTPEISYRHHTGTESF